MRKLFLALLASGIACSMAFAGMSLNPDSPGKPYAPNTVLPSEMDNRAPYTLFVGGGAWDSEITWEIYDAAMNLLYADAAGTFAIDLPDGSYFFYGYDSYGDGWNGGYAEITNDCGTQFYADYECETYPDPPCPGFDVAFDVPQPAPVYLLSLGGGSWTYECSWEILDMDMNLLYSGADAVVDMPVELCDGCYTLNAYDSYGDGWNGNFLTLVDGLGDAHLNYTLVTGDFETLEFCLPAPPPPFECPEDAVPEGEPLCEYGYDDVFNGGCNSDPVTWGVYPCGETVCGTSGVFNYPDPEGGDDLTYRETDWLAIDVEPGVEVTVTITIATDFPGLGGLVTDGGPDCSGAAFVDGYYTGPEPFTFDVTFTPEPDWTYGLFVAPSSWDPLDCGALWYATVEYDCPAIPGDSCEDPLEIAVPSYDVAGTTCGFTSAMPFSDLKYNDDVEDVFYHFYLQEQCNLNIDLCDSAFDTWIALLTDDCATVYAYNDDDCGMQSYLYLENLPAGDYYLVIEGYSGCGDYVLDVFCDEATVVEPVEFALTQNYPNPFNPTTTIDFSLAEPTHAALTVYSVTGQQVATLVNEDLPAGHQSVVFDATNLPSGLYFYTLRAGDFVDTRKMVVVK